MTPAFIDFLETYNNDGSITAELRANEPLGKRRESKDYRLTITVRDDGWCETRSRAYGMGSTRYYTHKSYDEAQAHAVAWARRKIAEARRNT